MCATIWHDHPNSRPSIAQHVGGYDANPIEQLHARTVERIIKDYPEFPYKARDKAPAKMSTSKKQTMTWDGKLQPQLSYNGARQTASCTLAAADDTTHFGDSHS